MKDYLQQAALTAPKEIIGSLSADMLLDCLKEVIDVGNRLDAIKKHMFYGKDMPCPTADALPGHVPLSRLPALLLGLPSEHAAVEVIHGVVGSITETVELAEALVDALETGTPIDVVNLAEEGGDVIWYLACILRHGGKDFPALMEQNIAKLRKRYPDGFTTYDAINRDLEAERQVLEQPVAAKPVVNLRGAVLLPGNDDTGPVLKLCGDAEGHPEHGDNTVRTSRILKFDATQGLYETANTVYRVISWAM